MLGLGFMTGVFAGIGFVEGGWVLWLGAAGVVFRVVMLVRDRGLGGQA